MKKIFWVSAALAVCLSGHAADCGVSLKPDGGTEENGMSFWERVGGREGKYSVISAEGKKGLTSSGVIYVKIDDKLDEALLPPSSRADSMFALEIVYYDGAPGSFHLYYDSSDATCRRIRTQPGAWRTPDCGKIPLNGDRQWKTLLLPLPYADFKSNRLNGGDLRFDLHNGAVNHFAIGSLRVKVIPALKRESPPVKRDLRVEKAEHLHAYSYGARHRGNFVQEGAGPLVMEAEHAAEITGNNGNPVLKMNGASGDAVLHYVESAKWDFEIRTPGRYRIWLRSFFPHSGAWNHSESLGEKGGYVVDGTLGPADGWRWIRGIAADLSAGKHSFSLNYMGGARLDQIALIPEKNGKPESGILPSSPSGARRDAKVTCAEVRPFQVKQWKRVTFDILNAAAANVLCSTDGGKSWKELPAGGDLSAVPCRGDGSDRIRFQVAVNGIAGKTPLFNGGALEYLPGSGSVKVLENSAARIEFDGIRVRRIVDKKRGSQVLRSSAVSAPLAELTVKKTGDAPAEPIDLLNAAFEGMRSGGTKEEPELQFQYSFSNGIRFSPKVRLRKDGQSEWTASIETPPGLEVCELAYPVFHGVSLGADPSDDLTFCAETWRQIWRNAYRRKGGKMPTSVRFMAMWDAKQGVYLGIEDPRFDDWYFHRSSDGNGGAMMGVTLRMLAKGASRWESGVCRLALVDGGSWIPAADIARSYNRARLKQPDIHPCVKWLADGWIYPDSNRYPWSGWDVLNSMDWDQYSGRSFTEKGYCSDIPFSAVNRQMLDGADAAYCGVYPYPCLVWGSVREFREKLALHRALGGFLLSYINFNLWAPGYGHYKRIGSYPKVHLPSDAPLPDDNWYAKVATRRYDGSYARVETEYFEQYPMAVCSPEWRRWLREWTARYLKWGGDGMYYDQLNMTYYNGRLYPDFAESYGSWIKASAETIRRIKEESRRVNPYSTSAGEVCNEIIGQYLDLHMTSGVFAQHQVYKYANPSHLVIDGRWNGGDTLKRHRFIWQTGARFEQGIYPQYLALRRAVKSMLYDAEYMDAKGIVIRDAAGRTVDDTIRFEKGSDLPAHASTGVTGRWFLYLNGKEKGAVINLINVASEKRKGRNFTTTSHQGMTLSIDTAAFGAVRHAMVFPLAGAPFVLKGSQKGTQYTFDVPAVEAASVVLSNHVRPLVQWSQDPVTCPGGTVTQKVKIINVNAEALSGTVCQKLPASWRGSGKVSYGPLPSGAETELLLRCQVPENARQGRYDVWTEVSSGAGSFNAYHYAVVNPPLLADLRGRHGTFRLWLRNLSGEPLRLALSASGKAPLHAAIQKETTLAPKEEREIPLSVSGMEKLRELSRIEVAIRGAGMNFSREKAVMPRLPNADFETDSADDGKPDWWMCRYRPSGAWAYEKISLTTDAHGGKHALRIEPSDRKKQGVAVVPVNFDAEDGKSYRISFYTKSPEGGNTLMFAGHIIPIPQSKEWVRTEKTLKVSAVRWNYFQIVNQSSAELLIDDIALEDVR